MKPAPREDTAPGRIVVGISGGVDSSVAALLLKQAGYDVQAVFMKNWNEPTSDGRCRWEEDVDDALAVCEKLDIPINTVDLSADYWDGVFRNFLDEYAAGRTPNPDILCNREIKFKAFVDYAAELGSTQIATGHYARSIWRDGAWRLLRGLDEGKDQSYFLYTLGQSHLAATRFPLGELRKPRVRAIARSHALATHDKKDSTGICFIGEQRFREFLGRYLPARPGEIRTLDETCIGSHGGVFYYTLGQRQGLGIGGVRGAREAPWYVVRKDVADNVLYVAQDHDHPLLMSRRLAAEMLSWTSGEPPPALYRCTARTRYRQTDQPCTVRSLGGDRCEVEFDQPQWAVTPGQSVVFYAGEECLGGGVITAAD